MTILLQYLRKGYVGALCTGALLLGATAQTASAALPPEANQALTALVAEYNRAAAQYEESKTLLPNVYIGQLAALKRKYQEDGDLDAMLATVNEAKRFAAARNGEADPFELIPELPTDALVRAPAELRRLQDDYLRTYNERHEVMVRQVNERVGQLVTQLDGQVKELTKRNRIDDALAVRTEAARWRNIIEAGSAVSVVQQLAAKFSPGTVTKSAAVSKPPDPGSTGAPWRTWKLDRIASYAQEGSLFAHPDLPDELYMYFDEKEGELKVQGVCTVGRASVEMRERTWFGKAIRWSVPAPEQLQATFNITSQELSPNTDSGPSIQLVLQSDKTRLQTYTMPLTYREITLRLEYDEQAGILRVGWVQAQTTTPLLLPADAKDIRLMFTTTLCRIGERCNSVITIR